MNITFTEFIYVKTKPLTYKPKLMTFRLCLECQQLSQIYVSIKSLK